jgi:hypothetical protein
VAALPVGTHAAAATPADPQNPPADSLEDPTLGQPRQFGGIMLLRNWASADETTVVYQFALRIPGDGSPPAFAVYDRAGEAYQAAPLPDSFVRFLLDASVDERAKA